MEDKLEKAISDVLILLGEDITREGLQDTPKRVAKHLRCALVKPPINFKVFSDAGADELVVQNGIRVSSMCEHHMLNFLSSVSIGYIPSNGRVCGLSKLARVAQHFSAAFTIQERLTRQIGEYLMNHSELRPRAVGVSVRSTHLCMVVRGCDQPTTHTTTQFLAGLFKSEPDCRQEFLKAVEHTALI